MRLALLGEDLSFPDVNQALEEPNGLLAVGGDLSPQRLLTAYSRGIFPWYDQDEPILWWSPSPRSILHPETIHISRSTRKAISKNNWQFSVDLAFEDVIYACADERFEHGTWISDEMMEAYSQLHQLGHAHSMEVWHDELLVGGLYGVHIGGVFFGESMFHRESNASKAALLLLQNTTKQQGIELIDCQIQSDHLDSLGAQLIDRRAFSKQLATLCIRPHNKMWQHERKTAQDIIDTNKQLRQREA